MILFGELTVQFENAVEAVPDDIACGRVVVGLCCTIQRRTRPQTGIASRSVKQIVGNRVVRYA